MNISR